MTGPPPSPWRLGGRAAWLLLPLLIAALAIPRIRASIEESRRRTAATARAAGEAEGAPAPAAGEADRQAPRHPAEATADERAGAAAAARALRAAQGAWRDAEIIAPRDAHRGADGEVTAPFQGFGLSVETEPEGATLQVDGRELGETPIVASVSCAPGDELEVRLERRGARPWRGRVRCRADTLRVLHVALPR